VQRDAAYNNAMFIHDRKNAFSFIMGIKYTASKAISGMIIHLRSCTTVVKLMNMQINH
jgi:hypothetical protein